MRNRVNSTPAIVTLLSGLLVAALRITAEQKDEAIGSYSQIDIMLSALLVIVVVSVLTYFTG